MSVLPVVNFNERKYDIDVTKAVLIEQVMNLDPAGEEPGEGIQFTINKLNSVSCIESYSLPFVDTNNFKAPGSNYAGYLKALGADEPKGFFFHMSGSIRW